MHDLALATPLWLAVLGIVAAYLFVAYILLPHLGKEKALRHPDLLDGALQAAGIAHEVHVDPGPHDRSYWQAHTPDYLEFYGKALTS